MYQQQMIPQYPGQMMPQGIPIVPGQQVSMMVPVQAGIGPVMVPMQQFATMAPNVMMPHQQMQMVAPQQVQQQNNAAVLPYNPQTGQWQCNTNIQMGQPTFIPPVTYHPALMTPQGQQDLMLIISSIQLEIVRNATSNEMRMFLFNQMTLNNWDNPNFRELIEYAANEAVSYQLVPSRYQSVSQWINECVGGVIFHRALHNLNYFPDLIRYIPMGNQQDAQAKRGVYRQAMDQVRQFLQSNGLQPSVIGSHDPLGFEIWRSNNPHTSMGSGQPNTTTTTAVTGTNAGVGPSGRAVRAEHRNGAIMDKDTTAVLREITSDGPMSSASFERMLTRNQAEMNGGDQTPNTQEEYDSYMKSVGKSSVSGVNSTAGMTEKEILEHEYRLSIQALNGGSWVRKGSSSNNTPADDTPPPPARAAVPEAPQHTTADTFNDSRGYNANEYSAPYDQHGFSGAGLVSEAAAYPDMGNDGRTAVPHRSDEEVLNGANPFYKRGENNLTEQWRENKDDPKKALARTRGQSATVDPSVGHDIRYSGQVLRVGPRYVLANAEFFTEEQVAEANSHMTAMKEYAMEPPERILKGLDELAGMTENASNSDEQLIHRVNDPDPGLTAMLKSAAGLHSNDQKSEQEDTYITDDGKVFIKQPTYLSLDNNKSTLEEFKKASVYWRDRVQKVIPDVRFTDHKVGDVIWSFPGSVFVAKIIDFSEVSDEKAVEIEQMADRLIVGATAQGELKAFLPQDITIKNLVLDSDVLKNAPAGIQSLSPVEAGALINYHREGNELAHSLIEQMRDPTHAEYRDLFNEDFEEELVKKYNYEADFSLLFVVEGADKKTMEQHNLWLYMKYGSLWPVMRNHMKRLVVNVPHEVVNYDEVADKWVPWKLQRIPRSWCKTTHHCKTFVIKQNGKVLIDTWFIEGKPKVKMEDHIIGGPDSDEQPVVQETPEQPITVTQIDDDYIEPAVVYCSGDVKFSVAEALREDSIQSKINAITTNAKGKQKPSVTVTMHTIVRPIVCDNAVTAKALESVYKNLLSSTTLEQLYENYKELFVKNAAAMSLPVFQEERAYFNMTMTAEVNHALKRAGVGYTITDFEADAGALRETIANDPDYGDGYARIFSQQWADIIRTIFTVESDAFKNELLINRFDVDEKDLELVSSHVVVLVQRVQITNTTMNEYIGDQYHPDGLDGDKQVSTDNLSMFVQRMVDISFKQFKEFQNCRYIYVSKSVQRSGKKVQSQPFACTINPFGGEYYTLVPMQRYLEEIQKAPAKENSAQ